SRNDGGLAPPPGGGRSARASGPGGGDGGAANEAPPSPHPRLPPAVRPSPSGEGGRRHGGYIGPFPHHAPAATISAQNPIGTDGFEFVEFAHPQPLELARLFRRMGYSPVARHRTKNITVYRQGDVNFILNADPGSFATRFVSAHGPCAPSMAWRVV